MPVTPKSQTSNLPHFLENLFTWAADNHMQENSAKTKEMILGPLSKKNFHFSLPLQVP